MKQQDYNTAGVEAAKAAVAGLSDDQLNGALMQERGYVSAMADATALTAAEQGGVKKTTKTFFEAFTRTFTGTVQERQGKLREAAKPVFWGDDAAKKAAFEGSDVRLWTLVAQMDEIKSTRRDVVSQLQSLIRDAQRTLERVTYQDESKVVNEKLYPVYDENLAQMGMRADAGVLKLRVQQEATRTMVGLVGMRLPTREELLAAGLIAETKDGEQ